MGVFRRNRATIVAGTLVVALVAAVAVASVATRANGGGAAVVVVHAGDGSTRMLPLDEDATVTVTTELGTNVVAVENGAARMVEADCPNGSCLRQHAISTVGEQIVCLPHRLWVEIAATDATGGTTLDIDAVTWDDTGGGDAGDAKASTVDLVAR